MWDRLFSTMKHKKSGCLCARALSVRNRRLHKWFCVLRSCGGLLPSLRTPFCPLSGLGWSLGWQWTASSQPVCETISISWLSYTLRAWAFRVESTSDSSLYIELHQLEGISSRIVMTPGDLLHEELYDGRGTQPTNPNRKNTSTQAVAFLVFHRLWETLRHGLIRNYGGQCWIWAAHHI